LLGFFLMGVVLLSAMAVLDWLVLTRLVTARAAWVEGAQDQERVVLEQLHLRALVPVPHVLDRERVQ